jgi:hypothetical protein
VSQRVTVTPDPFTLIAYDGAEIAAIVEDVAALIGLPSNVDIRIDVDEELFAPLVGHMSDVVDGGIVIWISGANFEDNRRPRTFSAAQARRDLTIALLRAQDRLSPDFADAPPDAELTRAERAAWDAYAVGRAERLGAPVRRQAQVYEYRLQHGFSDVADAAFERLWDAPSTTFAALREICAETGAEQRTPSKSKIPIDLLRQK